MAILSTGAGRLVVTLFELLEQRPSEYLAETRRRAVRENGPKSVVRCVRNWPDFDIPCTDFVRASPLSPFGIK